MRRKNLIFLYILAFLLNLPVLLFGQDVQTYKGSFKAGKYKGEANYNFIKVDNDTLLNGPFHFQRSNLKALIEKEDLSFSIHGNFENNLPSGYWSFRFNEFQSNSKSTVEEYRYVVNVNGLQQIAFGNLKGGKPDGEWSFKIQQIKDSEVDRVIFKSVIEFDRGVPQRSFRIEGKQQELVGRFLRNGLAHDEWTLYSDNQVDEIESWYFDEGVLKKIRLYSRSSSKDITIYKKIGGERKTIPLDEKYLDILKLKLGIEDSTYITQSGILDMLAQNDEYYQNIDTILSRLSNSSFAPDFKVSVPYFPLEDVEKESMNSIVDYYNKSRSISDALLGDSHLAIMELSDKKIRFLETSVDSLSKNILDPLEQLIGYYKDDLFPYVNREELVLKIWKQKSPAIKSFQNHNGKQDNTLQILNAIIQKTYNKLDSVQSILSTKIDKQKQKQEIIVLEKRMIDQRDSLDQLITSVNVDSVPRLYYDKLQKLKTSNETKLGKYATIKDVDQKLNYARELVDCFEKWNKVAETAVKIPAQLYDIEQEYLDAVWNPFTATVMNETVKRRIIAAYENVLIPYFLQKFDEEELGCYSNKPWIDLVNATYRRMLEMRREDTKKMERKLKKEDDPNAVLQRFGIQIKNNEK